MSWDTVKSVVRRSHQEGAWDMLRTVLDQADALDGGHECMALAFARRLYRDPEAFTTWARSAQQEREQ